METVSKEKQEGILLKMRELGILEKDIEEQFIRGGGKGGQKKNKTSSCVILKHIPTGIQVRYQKYRTRSVNQILARRLLCEKIEEVLLGKKSVKQQEIEMKRKQKKRRERRSSHKKRT